MSDKEENTNFFNDEAEEDNEEEMEVVPKGRNGDDDDDDEEEEGIENEEEQCRKEGKGWIVEDEDDDEDKDGGNAEKDDVDKGSSSDEEDVDDEDFDLIRENIGIDLRRKKKRSRLVIGSDSEDEPAEKLPRGEEEEEEDSRKAGREEIARGLFDNEDAESSRASPEPRPMEEDLAVDEDEDEEGEYDDEDDMGDFIVGEDGRPMGKRKKKVIVHKDASLQQAQEIFGVDFDYDQVYGADDDDEDEDMDEDEDEYEDEDDDAESVRSRRKIRKKGKRERDLAGEQGIYDLFEPDELQKGFFTKEDEAIRKTDMPERFQLRTIPVRQMNPSCSSTYAEELEELTEEAEWIWKNAFRRGTISAQEPRSDGVGGSMAGFTHHTAKKSDTAIPKIKECLKLFRENLLEVPFIAFYRKEYIEDLNINDLWKIWQWDEKWSQFVSRRSNLQRLMERMRDYLEHARNSPTNTRENLPKPPYKSLSYARRQIENLDEVHDVSTNFFLHYGEEIPAMKAWEARRNLQKEKESKKKAAEGEEGGEKEGEEEDIAEEIAPEPSAVARRIGRSSAYTLAMRAGLGPLVQRFGLSSEQFADNMRDQYQRHDVDQCPMLPQDAAEDFLSAQFATSQAALTAARYLLAQQISSEPIVRKTVRRCFFDRARLTVRPTKRGRKEIDEHHAIYPYKYLKNKPVSDLRGEMFLQIYNAAQDNLVTYEFNMDDQFMVYFDEIKNLFQRDEYSALVKTWNTQRLSVLQSALTDHIYPRLRKELTCKLLEESREGVLKLCARKMFDWLKVAPYTVESSGKTEDVRSGGARVLAVAFSDDRDISAFAVQIEASGEVVDYLKLPDIMRNNRSPREDIRALKEKDMARLAKFIRRYRPHVITVGCENKQALTLQIDIKELIGKLEAERELPPIQVELMDNEPALIYAASKKAEADFPEYPLVLRQAISLARRLQDPLIELAQLANPDEDILNIHYHPLQEHIPRDGLMQVIETEFINRVNEVGVDINRCLMHPHTANLIQFVCGLGPRKGFGVLRTLKHKNIHLSTRAGLVVECKLGPHVVINCAGFIKIVDQDTSSLRDQDADFEVLDSTRVHPQSYDLACKMAVDAMEYEDSDERNHNDALEEILESPERLRDLDLDAFAEELKRQDHGDKHITLYDIRKELNHRYKDLRQPYRPPNAEERFNWVTKETPETFHIGRLVECIAMNVLTRKPRSDQLDNANPVRSEITGLWICPFCQKDNFQELSYVWNHFDTSDCPGQPVGLRAMLDNGVSGFVPTRALSDKPVTNIYDRVKPNMNIHARITKIDIERFRVDLTTRSSDLRDLALKWKPQKDIYYDNEAEEADDQLEEEQKKQKPFSRYFNRINFHAQFMNITYGEVEKLMLSKNVGDVIIRPSSKGTDHLTASWKVDEGIIQHVDILELEKPNDFSVGKLLRIQNEEFEDLDEIIARYVEPMASYGREIMGFKHYFDTEGGNQEIAAKKLHEDKEKNPSMAPYLFSSVRKYPGKFMLSYMPNERPRHEYCTVTPEGVRYRGQVFNSLNRLIGWFKAHYSEPVPAPLSVTPNISRTPGDPRQDPYATPQAYVTPTQRTHHRRH